MGASSAGSSSSSRLNVPGPSGPSRFPPGHQAIFDEFEAYPFSEDPNFNAGLPTVLQAIRGTKRTAAQIDEMIGRAQWFFFTRMKGVSIPWNSYASYANTPGRDQGSATPTTTPPTLAPNDPHSRGSTPHGAKGTGLVDGLAEARRMMASDASSTTPGREGEAGLSFATLCSLISEGRAADLPGVRQIPDQLNELPPSQSALATRPKPWEQQRTSPHGASAMFQNPSLAPTPPASDLAHLGAGFGSTTAPMNQDLGATPSYSYPYLQYPLSPLMGIAPQPSPAPGPFDHAAMGDPVDIGAGVVHPSRHPSPLQSFANLSFAPDPNVSADPYGLVDLQGQYDPAVDSGSAFASGSRAGAGVGGQHGQHDQHDQHAQSSGYYGF